MSGPWKACDIRGLYPSEVNADLLRRAAYGIGAQLPAGSSVVVAGDFRLSTPELKDAVIAGLSACGARILDAGQVSTPVAYFARREFRADAVLIVTASHNPPAHNGLKFMVGELPPAEEDIARLRDWPDHGAQFGKGGSREPVNAIGPYLEWILERWRGAFARRLSVVLDAGNGTWSELAPQVFERLGFEVTPLFCEIDGRFPNRSPNCALAENLGALCRKVREAKADLGIAWDGDGDRVAFVDGAGRVVSADQTSMLLARHLVHPGERVVYDIKLSDALRREIASLGGVPVMERSGHTFLKRRMIREGCALGCEGSGHFFFRELGGGDDGLFCALTVAGIVAENAPLDVLVARLPAIHMTDDVRVPPEILPYHEMADRLGKTFPRAERSTLDGLRLATGEGFVLVRPSVTEPVSTLRIEGLTRAALEHLARQCLAALPELSLELQEHFSEPEVIR
jgi:phosphomannomutase